MKRLCLLFAILVIATLLFVSCGAVPPESDLITYPNVTIVKGPSCSPVGLTYGRRDINVQAQVGYCSNTREYHAWLVDETRTPHVSDPFPKQNSNNLSTAHLTIASGTYTITADFTDRNKVVITTIKR